MTITMPLLPKCIRLHLHLSEDMTFEHVEYLLKHTPNSQLHHGDHSPVAPMPVASPGKGGALDGRGADTAVCKKDKTKETNHERSLSQPIPAQTSPG